MTTNLDRRTRIKAHIRHKVSGTALKPRLTVFRSNTQIYAQLIDDVNGKTLASASSLGLKDKVNKIQEITEELMDKTSKDLKEASTIHKPDMKDHSKDKFNMKLLVNQKLAIPLYDSEDKISKRMAKPNAKVPVSNVNYGNFSKVIISKKVYLIENKYIVQ